MLTIVTHMRKVIYTFTCIFFLITQSLFSFSVYDFTVIGAGPAGIITVTMLLENGVHPQKICWIDPEFTVGRMGKFYRNVPSNQVAARFTRFLTSCETFRNIKSDAICAVKNYDQHIEPPLELLANALQDITNCLMPKVVCVHDFVTELKAENDHWVILFNNRTLKSKKVILAHGSKPREIMAHADKVIDLDIALDQKKLQKIVAKDNTVLIVGSAHSALLVAKYLVDLEIKQVILLYKNVPFYGRYGGLEGITARWTKDVLEKNLAKNIIREHYTEKKFETYAQNVDKIIYAFGYEKNSIIVNGSNLADYDEKTGIIKNGLYGIGIAFPELYSTQENRVVPLIGVNSFMERAQKLIPEWINS